MPAKADELVAVRAEQDANDVVAEVETWLSRSGGFRAYAERVEKGATSWSQLRSTIWLAIHRQSLSTKAEELAACLERIKQHDPKLPGLRYDSERSLIESMIAAADEGLEKWRQP